MNFPLDDDKALKKLRGKFIMFGAAIGLVVGLVLGFVKWLWSG